MNQITPEDGTIRNIRRLIWLYFWLLLVEGALRKWALPQLSNPLLIVRDPVVLLMYALAFRARVFPKNGWVIALAIVGFLSLALTFVTLSPYLSPLRMAMVGGFGFRSNFLHLPLIFLMPRVLRAEDVKRFGWWTLILLVPMALIMVGQFRSAPDSFLNRTAGGEGEMMTSALGKVRTAGTFSFVVGVAAFFAMSTAFLLWGALRGVYKHWVLFAAGSATVIGIAVSGSRTVVGACALVIASLAIVLLVRPAAVNRFGHVLIVTLVLGFIVTRTPIFKEGFNVLSTRFAEAAEATDKSVGAGLIERVYGGFEEGLYVMTKAPFLGYGLGIGTNAGAKFLTGRSMFLLSEGEWSRVFLESGPVLGLAYVLCRCGIAVMIGLAAVRAVSAGNLLPLFLCSATFLPLVNGQFGQPTVLGFAVFISGMALAARNEEELTPVASSPPSGPPIRRPRPVASRSAYAARLHEAAAPREHTNGSVDR